MGLFKRSAPLSGMDTAAFVSPSPWVPQGQPVGHADALAGDTDQAWPVCYYLTFTRADVPGARIDAWFYAAYEKYDRAGFVVGRTFSHQSGTWTADSRWLAVEPVYATAAEADGAAFRLAVDVANGVRDANLPGPQWDGQPWR